MVLSNSEGVVYFLIRVGTSRVTFMMFLEGVAYFYDVLGKGGAFVLRRVRCVTLLLAPSLYFSLGLLCTYVL